MGGIADQRRPTARQVAWAKATLRAALRSDRIELDEFEARLERVLRASTYAEVHRQIADLPHPPAPLSLPRD